MIKPNDTGQYSYLKGYIVSLVGRSPDITSSSVDSICQHDTVLPDKRTGIYQSRSIRALIINTSVRSLLSYTRLLGVSFVVRVKGVSRCRMCLQETSYSCPSQQQDDEIQLISYLFTGWHQTPVYNQLTETD